MIKGNRSITIPSMAFLAFGLLTLSCAKSGGAGATAGGKTSGPISAVSGTNSEAGNSNKNPSTPTTVVVNPNDPNDPRNDPEYNPDRAGDSEAVSVPGNIAGAGFDPDKSSTYLIKNLGSLKCLTIKDNSTANGAPVEQETCAEGNAFQKFKFTEAKPGLYTIMSLGSFKVLEMRDKQTVDGTIIQQNDSFGADHQLFSIEKDRDSTDRIKSKMREAFFDVKYRSWLNGADIHIWEKGDHDSQLWLLMPTL